VGNIKCIATDKAGNVYVGGLLTGTIGLYKYDGTSWKQVGTFNTLYPIPPTVNALAYDSTNDIMYAGGSFKKSPSSPAIYYNCIAQRKVVPFGLGPAETWIAMGSGFNNTVFSLALDNNNILYAGGIFTKLGTASNSPQAFYVAKWGISSTPPSSSSTSTSTTTSTDTSSSTDTSTSTTTITDTSSSTDTSTSTTTITDTSSSTDTSTSTTTTTSI
jgi:hypothetical protein